MRCHRLVFAFAVLAPALIAVAAPKTHRVPADLPTVAAALVQFRNIRLQEL